MSATGVINYGLSPRPRDSLAYASGRHADQEMGAGRRYLADGVPSGRGNRPSPFPLVIIPADYAIVDERIFH